MPPVFLPLNAEEVAPDTPIPAATSGGDPSIAEPPVISERKFMLMGKSPGDVSVFIWCQ
jgi:hypothetical protein